jgi:hypothetical protein
MAIGDWERDYQEHKVNQTRIRDSVFDTRRQEDEIVPAPLKVAMERTQRDAQRHADRRHPLPGHRDPGQLRRQGPKARDSRHEVRRRMSAAARLYQVSAHETHR